MTNELISQFIQFFQQYPALTLLFVFIISFTESLVVVGLLIPGAIIMVMFGALISMNALDFWPTVLTAVLGAVSGDSISYWLGRKYKTKFYTVWPLSRHPEIIERANIYFDKYGAKSIFLGRFIGPIRPIVPAIAGMAGMPVKFFLIANISSALLWAPLYLLPGILFGLSLEVASEFTSKFILLIVVIILGVFILLWLLRYIYTSLKPHHEKFISALLNWGKKHPLIGEIPAAVFDKNHSEIRGLSILAISLILFSLLLSFSINLIIPADNISSFNQLIVNIFNTIQSPPLNSLMFWFNVYSTFSFIITLSFFLSLILVWQGNILALWHFLASFIVPYITILILSLFNPALSSNTVFEHTSIHPIIVISFFGFATFLFATQLKFWKQKYIYYFSAITVVTILLSQVYFSIYTFWQILYSIPVASIWFTILGVAYRRHYLGIKIKKTPFIVYPFFAFLLFIPATYQLPEKKFSTHDEIYIMSEHGWLDSGWQTLPLSRSGIFNYRNTTFNLQWSNTEEKIETELARLGFKKTTNNYKKISSVFVKETPISDMPVFPHIHNGTYEKHRFIRLNNKNSISVVRLWPSNYQLINNKLKTPLWFGSIHIMQRKDAFGLSYLETRYKKHDMLQEYNNDLIAAEYSKVKTTESNQKIFLLK